MTTDTTTLADSGLVVEMREVLSFFACSGEGAPCLRQCGADTPQHCEHFRAGESIDRLDRILSALTPATDVQINAIFETTEGALTGRMAAEVRRIEHQDDGTITVVIDHWPEQHRAATTDNDALVEKLNSAWAGLAEYGQSDFANAASGEYGEDLLHKLVNLLSQAEDTIRHLSAREARLREAARREGMEEAARIAGGVYTGYADNAGQRIAKAIREAI